MSREKGAETTSADTPRAARPRRRSAPDGQAAPEHRDGSERDILETAWTVGRFNTFTTAAREAGLEELLTSEGPLTVFAPTDRAFAKLSASERDALMADPARMADVLRHHVVEGKVKAPRADQPRVATPMHGADLTLTTTDGVYHVGAARLVKTNFRASNGVIHAIDTVLMPR